MINQIICAAIKFADGRIVRGHRHDGCFLYAKGWTPKPDPKDHIQGFMDANNEFKTREEAGQIQRKAGIKSFMTGNYTDFLFSEDLY